MINLEDHSTYHFYDVCDIERAKSGKTYSNAIRIPLSAVDRNSAEMFRHRMALVTQPETFDTDRGYGIITVKNGFDTEYMFVILSDTMPDFLARCQDDMNINPAIFKFYELELHNEIETQRAIAQTMRAVDIAHEQEERTVSLLKKVKEYCLGVMFCDCPERDDTEATTVRRVEQLSLFDEVHA